MPCVFGLQIREPRAPGHLQRYRQRPHTQLERHIPPFVKKLHNSPPPPFTNCLLFAPLLRNPKRAREPLKLIQVVVYGFLPLLLGLPTLLAAVAGRHQQKCERNEPEKLQRRKDRLNGAPEERRYFFGLGAPPHLSPLPPGDSPLSPLTRLKRKCRRVMEGSSSSTSKQQQLPLSGRLQRLKFMQRAKAREEALEQKQEGEVERALNESHWMLAAPGHGMAVAALSRKSVLVIMEGDPKPSAPLGRMSFQNFNPAVENMVEELELRLPSLGEGMLTSNKEASEEDSSKSQPEDEESGAAAPAAVYANDGSLRKKVKMENTVVVETGVTTTTFVSRYCSKVSR
ncbi:hypothetical protein CY35_01G182500 [Sphagnum magellanicum]|nr:hypothetical protein CY35_01G182500 [Sphagnum magellanicum]KAH9576796.1 hypothetical protein CY35_01G182500 [Sphagnum magellanicum]